MFGYIKNMFIGLLNDWKTGSFDQQPLTPKCV